MVHRTSAAGGLVALIALVGVGCTDPETVIDAPATIDAIEQVAVEIEEAENAYGTANSQDPFSAFGFPAAKSVAGATTKVTPVWLINGAAGSVVISGRGGAGSVVLDTLAAADSVLVRIETRADTVVLEALSEGSTSLGTVAVPMDSKPQRVAFPR
jgi:hypothetical protein